MQEPTTHSSVIKGIRDEQNEPAWNQFDKAYKPFIFAIGRALHLTAVEQEELVSAVMLKFFSLRKTFRYDPARGRFRHYFKQAVRFCAYDIIRKRVALLEDIAQIEIQTEEPEPPRDTERKLQFLVQALDIVRAGSEPRTFAIFQRYALEDCAAADVAREFDCSIQSVYDVKNRIIGKLKKISREMTQEP